MTTFTEDIISQFKSRKNVEYLMQKISESGIQMNLSIFREIHNYAESISDELGYSDPMPGTSMTDHMTYFNRDILKRICDEYGNSDPIIVKLSDTNKVDSYYEGQNVYSVLDQWRGKATRHHALSELRYPQEVDYGNNIRNASLYTYDEPDPIDHVARAFTPDIASYNRVSDKDEYLNFPIGVTNDATMQRLFERNLPGDNKPKFPLQQRAVYGRHTTASKGPYVEIGSDKMFGGFDMQELYREIH